MMMMMMMKGDNNHRNREQLARGRRERGGRLVDHLGKGSSSEDGGDNDDGFGDCTRR